MTYTVSKKRGIAERPVERAPTALRDHRSMTENVADNEKTCPTCGRDDLVSERGLQIHHSKAHGERLITEVSKECRICGAEFTVDPADNPERHTTCGSDECQKATWSQTGEDHSQWKEKVEITCKICGDTTAVRPSQAEKVTTCRREECTNEAKRRTHSGKNHYAWTGKTTINCVICGAEINVYPSQVDKISTCSEECRAAYFSDLHTGEGNPMWAGGSTVFGENWREQRQKRLERDGYRCVICGVTQEAHRDAHGCGLHVHHITPRRTFDDPDRANRVSNLRTLCLPHHNMVEGWPVMPDTR